jgi:mannitol 2-dehydrogenase
MVTRLSLSTVGQLRGRVPVPSYERGSLTPGIVHFGVGNFHRAHFAVYLDDLFNLGEGHDWALVGAGVLASDDAIRQKLAAQDYLTTIVEQETNVSAARVIGPMIDFVAPADKSALIARLADPAIRIVSLTITEGGYFIDPATGVFNPAHPSIAQDAQHPDDPATVFGLILAGLAKRRAAGAVPFTVMSCDNVPHNGIVARNAVVGLARLIDPKLAAWIAESVAFPNAMVDRITPATTAEQREFLAGTFGIDDQSPVFCEEFRQWVLEDKFTAGRPALEKVGVTFAADVTPFENMKIRILNGGHAVIAYPAGLMDIHFVHEAMENPLISAFLAKVHNEEIIPCVPPVPGTDLEDYRKLVERRFSNPKIADTVRRLCLDGSNRQPKFIVPSIADLLKAGRGIAGLALESALWCRYCFGTTGSGKAIEPNDPNWDRLQERARAARENPLAWLEMEDIYGETASSPVFREAFTRSLNAVWAKGAEATVKAYLSGAPI